MNKIDIYISPYYKPDSPRTRLIIDGVKINNPNNRLTQFVVQRSMSRWLRKFKRKLFIWKGFFYELALELNSAEYTINFFGLPEDYEQFAAEVTEQQRQLELDGRNVKIQMSFTPHYDLAKASASMREAYDDILCVAERKRDYELCDRIVTIKDMLSCVPSRVVATDEEMQAQIDRKLEKDPFIHKAKHPKAIAVVADGSADAETVFSEIVKASQEHSCTYIPVLVPESADKQVEQKLIGMLSKDELLLDKVYIHRYSDDPFSSLKNCIYHDYMPSVINKALEEYDDIVRHFNDSDKNSYIAFINDANDKIEEIFL